MGYLLKLINFLEREKLLRLIIAISLLIMLGSLGITVFEKDVSFVNALWWSLVTLTTVGYGDIAPVTLGGRIIGIVIMFLGIGVLGLFTATIAGIFVDRKFREEKGMLKVEIKDHFIICGWNHRAVEIIHELKADPQSNRWPILLLADLPSKPFDDDFFFIHGDVTEENLIKANIKEAKTVIILLDDKLDIYSRDAKAVLNTLTVESLNPDVYTCVELISSKNIDHCKRAKADEIIISEEYSGKLLSLAAINHGITTFIAEILSKRYGNDLYKVATPDFVHGKTFIDLLILFKKEHNCLVVAIQSLKRGVYITNPSSDYIVEEDDYAIVLSKKRPYTY